MRALVPLEIQGKFHVQKDGMPRNVLAVITFHLKSIYVLVGWKGNTPDSCILSDALTKPNELNIPKGMKMELKLL